MRKFATRSIAAAALLASPALAATPQDSGFWQTPTIHGYGKIHYLPGGAYQPRPDRTYKIVFALTKASKSPDAVNPALDHVARTVNLYVAAGVPLDHLKFVAVASGGATPIALDNAHYRAAYKVDNPNLPLIAELKKAGVDVAICGQAVAEHDLQYDWVDPSVTLALSALTTITDLEHDGYALMPM